MNDKMVNYADQCYKCRFYSFYGRYCSQLNQTVDLFPYGCSQFMDIYDVYAPGKKIKRWP